MDMDAEAGINTDTSRNTGGATAGTPTVTPVEHWRGVERPLAQAMKC